MNPFYGAIEFRTGRVREVVPDEEFERSRVDGGNWLDEPFVITLAVEVMGTWSVAVSQSHALRRSHRSLKLLCRSSRNDRRTASGHAGEG